LQSVKFYKNANDAIKDILDESTVLVGGFDGNAGNLIKELYETKLEGLTCVSNNAGICMLFKSKIVKIYY
jgi:acyl CoA:acetate/3-ketoacid CoA transferase alpha subunit